MSLRPYQSKAIEEIKAHYAAGRKKVLLHLATGGGKTHIFSHVIKQANERQKRAIMVVRGRKLVDQASQRLFHEHVPHGVRMANHWNKNYAALTQVCSIDTLISRQDFPPADIVIIDEGHMAVSDGYVELAARYPGAFFLAVTATPYTRKPLAHIVEAVVHPISMLDLIAQGFLVPFRYFAPTIPDLSAVGVSASTHDYITDQLEKAMSSITGDLVRHWRELGGNRPTVCFAVNVHHSKQIVDMFNAEGIAAEHCDADTPDKERAAILRRLESGEIKIVSNVGILCTGVDMPYVGTILMARATKSYNLFVQQCGRGTRIFEGKKNCILLDHAGNVLRHGFPTDEPEIDIGGKMRSNGGVNKSRICKKCYLVYQTPSCPDCGPDQVVGTDIKLEIVDGQLQEVFEDPRNPIQKRFDELDEQRKRKGMKKGYVYYQMVREFGYDACEHFLPQWFREKWTVEQQNPFAGSPFNAVSRRA